MRTLGVVITTFNEQTNIERALYSVRWANEIVVVDGNSSDDTVKIARKYTSNILQIPNNANLNINKNFGFAALHSDWTLSLDADEEVSELLADEIHFLIDQEEIFSAYRIPRKNMFLSKWIRHGNWYPDLQIRLFKQGKGSFPCNHVHEQLSVQGPVGEIQNSIIHYSYPSMSVYFKKFNRYTLFEAQALVHSRATGIPVKIGADYRNYSSTRGKYSCLSIMYLSFHFMMFQPIQSFFNQYFCVKGYMDGWRGIFIALFSALYYPATFLKHLFIRWTNRGHKS